MYRVYKRQGKWLLKIDNQETHAMQGKRHNNKKEKKTKQHRKPKQ